MNDSAEGRMTVEIILYNNLQESMGPDRDRTCDPWIGSQTQTHGPVECISRSPTQYLHCLLCSFRIHCITPCHAELEFILFKKTTTLDPDQLASDKAI